MEIGGIPMTSAASPFGRFTRQKTILLTTYKRDGTPVGTPVSIAVDGDRAYFRTYEPAWKVKRLRNNPDVEIAPSTARGKPTGEAMHATATRLEGEEAAGAARALAHKYRFLHGFLVPFMHRRKGWKTLHYALTARDE
ncbi:PPOX class F420-dependent oxidoreductase [Actinacidiphila bryophytorum]|nr:PPOX class F420-dependent oxidoreductase [Actinacidiphila bryophytorum]